MGGAFGKGATGFVVAFLNAASAACRGSFEDRVLNGGFDMGNLRVSIYQALIFTVAARPSRLSKSLVLNSFIRRLSA
jgi:hypothetical protein